MTYDLALLNATVVDGTGRPAVVTDVAISGDRIARVGPLDDAARVVRDLHGRVVTPGFVDLHSHSDYSLHADPLARSKLHQGVTTEVGGNCGYHAAPLAGGIADDRRREYRHSMGLDVTWSTSAEYRAALAAAAPSVNYAQQIGYNSLLSSVTGDRNERLSPTERDRLRTMVREEFAAGAVGLSYGLAYSPACFSSTDELVDVAEEAAAVGRVISFHLRNEDFGLLEALDEALVVARRSGAPCHIGHLKTFRRPNWHKLDDVFARLQAATDAGIDLTVDRYPAPGDEHAAQVHPADLDPRRRDRGHQGAAARPGHQGQDRGGAAPHDRGRGVGGDDQPGRARGAQADRGDCSSIKPRWGRIRSRTSATCSRSKVRPRSRRSSA
jgi:N-acyl-D-amino-acid deacylase